MKNLSKPVQNDFRCKYLKKKIKQHNTNILHVFNKNKKKETFDKLTQITTFMLSVFQIPFLVTLCHS